ncbi:GAF domain-containing protein [Roseococcus pinisoli]|uniref:GAF domain-containing protein n=1 Tax=Roseococcus pinisoli TaxID=2835040 RepID=A0ABS5QIT9_9PROT|nr:GAF domain-containing protein [Roseococcus pinisoli]MBS7813595.1 GAF domain-containing protein [Roseococcus pinisoli]
MSFNDLALALAQPGQPQTGIQALEAAAQELIGHKLFTLLVLDHERNLNSRCYSNRPAEYPALGYQPIDWTREFYKVVVERGEPRFLNNRADLARTFGDYEVLVAMGCESAVNMPVRWNGRTLGSVNLLNVENFYGPQHRPQLNTLAALAIAPFLSILESAGR